MALLVTETLPVTLPAVVGAKVTVKVAARPVFRIVPADTPLAVNPEAPPLWVAVKVTPVNTAGKMSCTDASETLLGPLLLIAIE